MATQVQFRRGTATQNNNFVGAEGELSVNLSNYSIRLHDGVTTGGYEMARANMSNAVFGTSVLPSANTTYNLGSASFKFANIFSESFTGALIGNADTTTQLATPRNINGVAFDGTQDITIEAAIDKTLTIGNGLSGGLFDGATDVTIALRNSDNFSNTNILKWDTTNGQFTDSLITDNGTTASVGGNLTVTGDLLVQGSTTTISTTNLVVSDKLIIIGDGTETTQGADGAGFNIGSTGVSLTYDLANTSWTSSESMNLAIGKTYKIAGSTVIGATALGSGVVSSSLTSLGTLTSLEVSGLSTFDNTATFNSYATFNEDIFLRDNDVINIGNESDLKIYHNATDSYIDNTKNNLYIRNNVGDDDNGDIIIQAKSGENSILCQDDGSVYLYYDNNYKLYTHFYGVEVVGQITHRAQIVRDNIGNATYYEYALNIENLSAGNQSVVDFWSYTGFNAAEYVITFDNYGVVGGVASAMQVTKLLVMSDGAGNLWTTEHGNLYTDEANPCFTASVDINGGNARLLITPNSSYTNQNNDLKIKATLFYR